MKQQYTDQELLDMLTTYYEKQGISPRKEDFPNKTTFTRRFGSWNKALKKANLPVRRENGYVQPERKYKQCVICGCDITNTRFVKYCNDCAPNCNSANNIARQRERGLGKKILLINILGGKCSKCGYKKNLASLVFHHVKEKSFSLDSRSLSNRSPEVLLQEAKKCILLCHNCHSEEHNPDLNDLL